MSKEAKKYAPMEKVKPATKKHYAVFVWSEEVYNPATDEYGYGWEMDGLFTESANAIEHAAMLLSNDSDIAPEEVVVMEVALPVMNMVKVKRDFKSLIKVVCADGTQVGA